ncbi:MAG: nucleotidyl transferase AbiEii/AbiGii toxin family protein [Cyclobacteriaceae bacterium]
MRDAPNNRFPTHFRDFIEELNRNEVEYMLIGGYAMGAFGHHRGTGDLDIFINATDDNAERLLQASVNYGIPVESVNKEMFVVPKMVGIGNPPLRIELIKKLDTVDFEYAYQRSSIRKLDDLEINIISLEDLILLKRAASIGRSKARDLEDLSFLEKLRAKLFPKGRDGEKEG